MNILGFSRDIIYIIKRHAFHEPGDLFSEVILQITSYWYIAPSFERNVIRANHIFFRIILFLAPEMDVT